MLNWLASVSLPVFVFGAATANLAMMMVGSTVVQRLRVLATIEVTATRRPSRAEWGWAVSTSLANTATAVVALLAWRADLITLRQAPLWLGVAMALGLTLFMDGASYAGHYIGHRAVPYRLVHRLHHRYGYPIVLDLFVMHPPEVFGFGGLCCWLLAAITVDLSAASMVAFLLVNLWFGLVGHLGVEILPEPIRRWRLFNFVTTPSFHAFHHLAQPRTSGSIRGCGIDWPAPPTPTTKPGANRA